MASENLESNVNVKNYFIQYGQNIMVTLLIKNVTLLNVILLIIGMKMKI